MLQPPSSLKNRTTVRSKRSVRLARAALHAAYALSEDLGTTLAERLFTSPKRYARPDRELPLLARGRHFTVDINLRSPRWGGTRTPVSCWRWGVGPTVLLVHGWEGRGAQLGSFVEPLVAAGLSVVAFDAPAHGDSPGSRFYLTDFADTVIDIAAAVGPLHAIVAHSFGCAAVLLAHARGAVDATRTVFIAPNILIPESVSHFTRTLGLDDDERALFETQLAENAGLPIEALRLDRLVGPRDSALTVIHDRGDREVPFFGSKALVAAWPGAHLIPTDGLGHRRILRERAVIDEVVASVRVGIPLPASDLIREIDRQLDAEPLAL